jgi:hypothetical protein
MRGGKPGNFRKSASNVFLQKVLYLLQLRCVGPEEFDLGVMSDSLPR